VSERVHLRRLAGLHGILAEYYDNEGRHRPTSDAARERLLTAMGVDASSEESACRTLEELDAEASRRFLEPVRIVWLGSDDHRSPRQTVCNASTERAAAVDWNLTATEADSGETRVCSGRSNPLDGRLELDLAMLASCAPGYYRMRIELSFDGRSIADEQLVIAAPPRCTGAAERLGAHAGAGLWTNLYTLRSEHNWGVGDIADLTELVRFAGERGLAFVGINPLHAQSNHESGISPYFPLSRLYMNPLYLDVAAVPELAECSEARAMCAGDGFHARLAGHRAAARLDHAAVWSDKRAVLTLLHDHFRRFVERGPSERADAYRAFRRAQGDALDDFATYLALADALTYSGEAAWDWQCWPEPYRHPRSVEVMRFRAEHDDAIDFHRYLQFELDRQLASVEQAADLADASIGIYRDLAVGIPEASADVWAAQHLFARGVAVGAPPDAFTDLGQDWGLAPVIPRALRADGYAYWRRLLRNALRERGALRIDHAMGLERQFWVPRGEKATQGAYVAYPREELLAILALESTRRGTVIVAEDLGDVPYEFRDALHEHGMLRSHILYFERDDGRFRQADEYAYESLATANTHDLPTLAGFWSGDDLLLRRRAGHIVDDDELERRRAERQNDREALVECLRRQGVVGHDWWPADAVDLTAAVHRFLARTPSVLVGLSLDDLARESEAVNLPSVPLSVHPSWTRRMAVELATVLRDPSVLASIDAVVAIRSD